MSLFLICMVTIYKYMKDSKKIFFRWQFSTFFATNIKKLFYEAIFIF